MAQIASCRICESPHIVKFLSLGATPPANNLVRPGAEGKEESYPLELYFCRKCFLVQLGYTVPPEILFRNYLYFSSTSETLRNHFAGLASEICERFAKEGGMVVEVGSNDGVLLRNFKGTRIKAVGFEPATNVAEAARKEGVETLNEFFNSDTAKKLRGERGPASAIVATNVFAHVAGLRDLVAGMQSLLADDGVVIIESHHLASMYSKMEFDSIYHEHLCYYSLRPLMTLFGLYGMEIFDAKKIPIHGGSLRIYVQKKGAGREKTQALSSVLAEEESLGLYDEKTHLEFASKIGAVKAGLVELLEGIRNEGKRVAGYGAPAKCTTLVNYCGIGPSLVRYIVDRSPSKQGMLVPGMHIPIFGTEKMEKEPPDFLLLFAWNLHEEIARQQEAFRKRGGRFIVPIPEPRII